MSGGIGWSNLPDEQFAWVAIHHYLRRWGAARRAIEVRRARDRSPRSTIVLPMFLFPIGGGLGGP